MRILYLWMISGGTPILGHLLLNLRGSVSSTPSDRDSGYSFFANFPRQGQCRTWNLKLTSTGRQLQLLCIAIYIYSYIAVILLDVVQCFAPTIFHTCGLWDFRQQFAGRQDLQAIADVEVSVMGVPPAIGWFISWEIHENPINVGPWLVWGYTIVSTDPKIIVNLWKWWGGTLLCPQDFGESFFSFFFKNVLNYFLFFCLIWFNFEKLI